MASRKNKNEGQGVVFRVVEGVVAFIERVVRGMKVAEGFDAFLEKGGADEGVYNAILPGRNLDWDFYGTSKEGEKAVELSGIAKG